MTELVKKLLEKGQTHAFESVELFTEASQKLGYGKEEIAEALEMIGKFPIEDETLAHVAGGMVLNSTHYTDETGESDYY